MVLIQKKTVLEYMGDVGDGSRTPARLLLPVTEVEALGRPEFVTVTIQVGNQLEDADAGFQADPGA